MSNTHTGDRPAMAAAPCTAAASRALALPTDRADEADHITLVGLLLETASGFRRNFAPGLERLIGVGGQSFDILVRLARSPGGQLRLADLAAQTGLTPSGLTRALDRLVEAGLVRREACPNDRRGAFAVLTGGGKERMSAALELHERDIAELLAGVLSLDEVVLLAGMLRRLRDRVHSGAVAGICVTRD